MFSPLFRLKRLGLVCTLLAVFAVCAQTAWAIQEVIVETAATTVTGVTTANVGTEVPIYTVRLRDFLVVGGALDLGNGTNNAGIRLLIDDLSTLTGLVSSDITQLNIYRDDDGILNGSVGETFMTNQNTVNIGIPTVIDVTALPIGGDRRIPFGGVGTGIYFIVSAVISTSAIPGHAFRVGAVTGAGIAGDHIGIVQTDAEPDYETGAPGVAVADGNHIVIATQQALKATGGRVTIPFGGEDYILLLIVFTGLYRFRKRSARNGGKRPYQFV